MKKEKIVYLDVDGTIADLWGNKNVFKHFANESTYPYAHAKELVTQDELKRLVKKGYKLGIITWLCKNATKEYNQRVEKVKRKWLKRHYPEIDFCEIHIAEYGIEKDQLAKHPDQILVDDDKANRDWWKDGGGKAYKPEWLKKPL